MAGTVPGARKDFKEALGGNVRKLRNTRETKHEMHERDVAKQSNTEINILINTESKFFMMLQIEVQFMYCVDLLFHVTVANPGFGQGVLQNFAKIGRGPGQT